MNGSLNESGSNSANFSSGLEINVVNVSADWTSIGDNWSLSCLASDGVYNSSWLNSSNVTIIEDYNLVARTPTTDSSSIVFVGEDISLYSCGVFMLIIILFFGLQKT